MDEDFGHWFAGLADGEGCFYIGGGNVGCQFLMELRADDGQMLEEIRDELGFGRIHYSISDSARTPTCRLEVTRRKDCLSLVHLFDKYPLRSKKARDFAIWRRAVLEHRMWSRHNSFDQYRLELAEARRYRGPDGVDVYVPPHISYVQESLLP